MLKLQRSKDGMMLIDRKYVWTVLTEAIMSGIFIILLMIFVVLGMVALGE